LEGVTGSVTLHPITDSSNDERTRFVAVLEIPPIVSAEIAVRVQIVKDTKGIK
jgi:hypothetical protein